MHKTGRPEKINKLVLAKLEEAFALGCTDREACFNAGINDATLYRYQVKYPEFCERKEALKQRPVLLARQSVLKHLQEDGMLALKYLERKVKDEFSLRSELFADNEFRISWIGDKDDGEGEQPL